ncbi:hypothetical protein L6R53_17105 [Myxococcota bacterium]|nr:hypothetical protein [Myxococcota bacterium]
MSALDLSSSAGDRHLAEPRIARRMRVASRVGPPPVARRDSAARAEQRFVETALRGRSARQVRACLRRMEPVFVSTPRWSRPQAFLEEIALDLAVGEPAIGCRTVGFRPMRGRAPAGTWPLMLQILNQLGRGGGQAEVVATAVDRDGFRAGVGEALEGAHSASRHRLAVLLHGIEHMPVEVLSDLVEQWTRYRERHPEGLRVALLLAGGECPAWLDLPELHRVELEDYSEAETVAALVARCGPLAPRRLMALARFTGGVPAMVDAVSEMIVAGRDGGQVGAARGARLDVDLLLHGMGSVADEIRGALDIVSARGELSDRLATLVRDGASAPLPGDEPLFAAGLVKRVRGSGQVSLRAPALAAMLG